MADVLTTINGEQVTLIDNLDGTYRIDLGTQDARRFVRGELDQLRAEKDALVQQRTQTVSEIDIANTRRLALIDVRDAINAEIDVLNTNIAELVAWLQGLGDPT